MSSALTDLVATERADRFARLARSRIDASIPLRQPLVDRVVAGIRLPSFVRGLVLQLLPDNQVLVRTSFRVFGFTKRIEALLRLPPAIAPGPPRTLQLAFVERSLLSTALGLAAPLLGRLPAGIEVAESGVTIDVDRLAARAGGGDLLPHVRGASFATRDGALWVDLAVEIEEGLPPLKSRAERTPPERRDRSPALPVTLTAAEIRELFEGLRARFSVRLAESMVNAAIAAALADARSFRGPVRTEAPAPGGLGGLLEAIGQPRVAFEPGAVTVDGELAL